MYIFFFFQAEDGIRDIGVTGVQTCALPISRWDLSRIAASSAPSFLSCRLLSSTLSLKASHREMMSARCSRMASSVSVGGATLSSPAHPTGSYQARLTLLLRLYIGPAGASSPSKGSLAQSPHNPRYPETHAGVGSEMSLGSSHDLSPPSPTLRPSPRA